MAHSPVCPTPSISWSWGGQQPIAAWAELPSTLLNAGLCKVGRWPARPRRPFTVQSAKKLPPSCGAPPEVSRCSAREPRLWFSSPPRWNGLHGGHAVASGGGNRALRLVQRRGGDAVLTFSSLRPRRRNGGSLVGGRGPTRSPLHSAASRAIRCSCPPAASSVSEQSTSGVRSSSSAAV
jgi:hypothetical protein